MEVRRPKPPLFGGCCGAFPLLPMDYRAPLAVASSSAMDAELDDEETLWAAEEELRAAQLMIEQAQRNRAEALWGRTREARRTRYAQLLPANTVDT